MRDQYILAIDQGTSGSTILIIEFTKPTSPRIIARCTKSFPQHYPQDSWVEHDLNEIWQSIRAATEEATALAKHNTPSFDKSKIIALGITNQRETLCVYDRKTLAPLHRAIVWQCKRSTEICRKLKAADLEPTFRDKTGLLLDPYFSGTKITWLIENIDAIKQRFVAGTAVCGTIDTYLISKLTSGGSFVTEPSNASRTLLFNINTGRWDNDLCTLLKVPNAEMLPEVRPSASMFGKTLGLDFLPDGIPITGVLGDQQAALAGQLCLDVGEAKCTYGTGAFLLLNIGNKPLRSRHGLLTTIAWDLDSKITYAFEGSAFIAGAAVQFVRDNLHFIKTSAESEATAREQSAAPEIYFVPALSGLGAPQWDPKAKGAFLGLTRATTKEQLVRATLEGMAFQVCDLLEAMQGDYEGQLKLLRVDGGAAANSLLLQMQANLANIRVERAVNLETTAFGAGLFAGLGIKLFSGLAELKNVTAVDRAFTPSTGDHAQQKRSMQLAGWQRAVRAVRLFAET